VVQSSSRSAAGYEAAVKHAAEIGALFCHRYDQPDVCAGQGTLGMEPLEQPGGQLDTVMVSVSGGGSMAGPPSLPPKGGPSAWQ
jgi:threonine dehydratase